MAFIFGKVNVGLLDEIKFAFAVNSRCFKKLFSCVVCLYAIKCLATLFFACFKSCMFEVCLFAANVQNYLLDYELGRLSSQILLVVVRLVASGFISPVIRLPYFRCNTRCESALLTLSLAAPFSDCVIALHVVQALHVIRNKLLHTCYLKR